MPHVHFGGSNITMPIIGGGFSGHQPLNQSGTNIVQDHRFGQDDGRVQGSFEIIKIRHPEWVMMVSRWIKYRLAYEGGDEFMAEFLYRYSKREDLHEYIQRRRITYNPAHAKASINTIRNALMVKLPDVSREGDQAYIEWASKDVDSFKSSMTTFMGLQLLPLLLSQGKRIVVMDAPPIMGSTLAEDKGVPFIFGLNSEDVLSWAYDDNGNFTSLLFREFADKKDRATGLVAGAQEQFRLMQLVDSNFKMTAGAGGEAVELTGPGVLVRVFDKNEILVKEPVILDLVKIPAVEFKLVDSLMTDIADMQIALVNLASTDMSFLFRGNFPMYTEQFDPIKSHIKPRGSRRHKTEDASKDINLSDRIVADEREHEAEIGNAKARRYAREMERPGYIAPPVENCKLSMEKQDHLAETIRMMVNLSLTSISVKALEQSGKSKQMDRIGEEAGLAYVGSELQTGERGIEETYRDFQKTSGREVVINYPMGYSVKTPEDREVEVASLNKTKSTVRSSKFQKIIDKRIIEIAGRNIALPEEIRAAQEEIEAALPMDDSKERAEQIQKDVVAGLVSTETGSELRGYGKDEALKVIVESELKADSMSGGPDDPPFGGVDDSTPPKAPDEGGEDPVDPEPGEE